MQFYTTGSPVGFVAEKNKFNNTYTSYIYETQENWEHYQNGWSHHLKNPLQNTDDDAGGGRSQLWEVTRKSTINKSEVAADLSHRLLHW